VFKSGRLDVEVFTREYAFALLESMCPYCCTSFDCISLKPGDGLRETLVDLSPFSDAGPAFFIRPPLLAGSFPVALLDDCLALRLGVALDALRATPPSEICGLPWEIFATVFVFDGPSPDVEGDSAKAFNNETEEEKKNVKEVYKIICHS
jgi:hypothetical protein